ncbi:MAG TPA: hypothetical protein VNS12_13195 [Pelagibacterium sp.]|uniref:hypothetical protein n=1 Tax=Pelagibacterium sp. TaxID=1967288 RepID=UPI002BCC769E|nr:hypothetical protein [Pelagibacterium sp.]HWJ89019.1 hypothetical protein [Pelagibacterium sp.]
MRVLFSFVAVMAAFVTATPVLSQGLSAVDAINQCEAFVEESIRPEFGANFKHPYKVICYFGLIDPQISTNPEAVCARVSRALGQPHRDIAEFMCSGAYHSYLSASSAAP